MLQNFSLTALALFILAYAPTAFAQREVDKLVPGKREVISLSPEESRSFSIEMTADGYAEVKFVGEENPEVSYGFVDASGKALAFGSSFSSNSAVFIAPKAGKYTFIVRREKSEDKPGPQNVTLEYSNKFSLPKGSKQKGIRRLSGYEVRIMFVPGAEDPEYGDNVVLFQKRGVLKNILRQGGNAGYMGFSFPDNLADAETPARKKQVALIQKTADKTGDGVPDVMIDYFSGGAHCCFSTYFVNLGPTAEVVEVINTDNASLAATSVNPKGGLRFSTNENAFAYWNIFYAGSPMPEVVLEFDNGKLRPNFALMKRPAPAMAKLKAKAKAASRKISNAPYTEVGMDFEEAFWDEMLHLIYSGHEDLAWKYFDMVWPVKKPGKEKFKIDFEEALAESYYGTKEINTSNSMRNSMRLFEKIYKSIKEQ